MKKLVQTKQLDRRVKRTKQRLHESLISLMAEKGFQSVTVQDITKRADVNRATFYSHYHDKHQMLECMITEVLQEFSDSISNSAIDNGTNEISTSNAFVRMFEHIGQHADFYKTMFTKKGVPGFAQQMLKTICHVFDQRRLKFQPNTEQLIVPQDILSVYTASSYLGLILYWLKSDMAYTPEYMAAQLTNITKLGLPTLLGLSPQEVLSNNIGK